MDFLTLPSILCLLIGLIIGGVVVLFSGISAGKKATKIIESAKKEADKTKRNSIMELKEEN